MSPDSQLSLDTITPDLSQVISTFAMQVMIACGKMMNPVSRKFETDLALAKYHIGVLEVLRAKTAGNLTSDEERLFEDVLHQSRMAFVDAGRGAGRVISE